MTQDLPRSDRQVGETTGRSRGGTVVLHSTTANIPVARGFVRRWLEQIVPRDGRAAADLTSDLELAASELVTNAIEHGTGSDVGLAVESDGSTVVLRVTSHGNVDDVGPTEHWEVADTDSVTGRGLGIVRAVAEQVAMHRRGDELRISVTRSLPPS